MDGTVSFKVYMRREDGISPDEVRRFGVEADAVTNFVYLREKLQTIFPSLKGKQFSINWKDSENDEVIISSDEELQIFLTETSSGQVRKLYVILNLDNWIPECKTSQSCNFGQIHLGVSCDSCDKLIQGFRYKCIQCPDFDLCASCEGLSLHPEHFMIRISSPLLWKPHYGRRLASHVNRFVKKAQCHTAREEKSKQWPYKNGQCHGRSHRRSEENPSWLDTFANYLEDWTNLPSECPMKEMAKEAKENEAPAAPDNATKRQSSGDKCPVEQIKLLSNVGRAVGENFLAQLLDPIVNMHGKKETTTVPSPQTPSTSDNVSPNKEKEDCGVGETNAPKFPGEGRKLKETVGLVSDSGDTASNGTTADKDRAPSVDKVASEKVSSDNEEWTLLVRSDSPTPSVVTPVVPSTGAIPKQAQASAPVDASSTSLYPSLSEAPKTGQEPPVFYHANPTIQKSVETMIQMGFSNEGGWLTNLLVSKGGDIAAALDALSPVRR